MKIEVESVRLASDFENPAIRAYVALLIDDSLVLKSVRVVQNESGRLIVGFPHSKPNATCPDCRRRIPVLSRFCAWCGTPQPYHKLPIAHDGSKVRVRESVYPVSRIVQRAIEAVVLPAYLDALKVRPFDVIPCPLYS